MDKITYSIESKNTFRDFRDSAKFAETYFKTRHDPTQMTTSYSASLWLYKNIPWSLNSIKLNKKVIGFTFILPCTKSDMRDFLSKKINENDLFLRVKKKPKKKNFWALYLCTTFILPKYRRKGIVFRASLLHAAYLMKKISKKPYLFYWGWSKKGNRLAQKISKALKIKLYFRS